MSVTTRSKAKAATEDQSRDSPVQPPKANRMEKLRHKLLEKVAEGTPIIEKLQVTKISLLLVKLLLIKINSRNYANSMIIIDMIFKT